jgi:serine carboxypeptidase-like clade II
LTIRASYDYYWMHAMISGKAYKAVKDKCGFNGTYTEDCQNAMDLATQEKGNIDDYDIYAPICQDASNPSKSSDSVYNIVHKFQRLTDVLTSISI